MRWIARQIIRLLQLLWVLSFLFGAYLLITGQLEGGSPTLKAFGSFFGAFFVGAIVLESLHNYFDRKRKPRPLKIKTPSPRSILKTDPNPVPVAPQRATQRRFAPIPLAEAMLPALGAEGAPSGSIPDKLLRFIERGEAAILSPQEASPTFSIRAASFPSEDRAVHPPGPPPMPRKS